MVTYVPFIKVFRATQVRCLTAATAAVTLAFLFLEVLCYAVGRLHSSCVLYTKIVLHRWELIDKTLVNDDFFKKQDSKVLSPRPLANAPKGKNSKCSKHSKVSKCSKFQPCLKFLSMFKMCLKYWIDTKWHNHINSCHSKNHDTIWYNSPWCKYQFLSL